ncbi:cell surface protein [Bacillus sp. OxB-1]|uniref:leucine-rich repeat domain-containing protein n=1 Tax=Bacillus sp. (strain OxB-1) TaxID=98228 RepID=UPI000581E02A|nr:leucine-rich repeat domain-containing protein [Bacillus sp. OxB-1]BAQ11134.1 cell surface protein [Bacillus sp. OxB-1]
MKKLVFYLMMVMLASAVFHHPAQAAEEKTYGDVKYKVVTAKNGKQEIHITGLSSYQNNIVIPSKIEGLPVVEIVDRAFTFDRSDYASDGTYDPMDSEEYRKTFIKSVQLPDTLKRIGDEALAGHSLTKIALPASLEEIGRSAFARNGLTALTIPASVKKMDGNIVEANPIKTVKLPKQFETVKSKKHGEFLYTVFEQKGKKEIRITGHTIKKNRAKLVIPAKINNLPVTEIGDYAFSEGNSLLGIIENYDFPHIKEIVLPPSIRKIGNDAFSTIYYQSNRPLQLPKDLEVIGNYAYKGNGSKNGGKELKFPAKIRVIGKEAFMYNQLQSVTIPSTVRELGKGAFAGNQLKKVTIGNGLTEIPANAFRTNAITNLTLPKQVKTIGDRVFETNKLPRIVLPASVETVEDFAFADIDRSELAETTAIDRQIRICGQSTPDVHIS